MTVLKDFFESIIVCFPSKLDIPESMQTFQNDGFLEIITPVAGDEDAIRKSMASFQSWANIHEGRSPAFLKSRKESVPFYDDTVTTHIRTEINRYKDDKLENADASTIFPARLFLQIAHDFDLNSLDAENTLSSLGDTEKNIMTELKGGKDVLFPDHTGGVVPAPGGVSNYMVPERIRAWCRLMLQSDDIPSVFITAGRTAYEYMLDNMPEATTVVENIHTNSGGKSGKVLDGYLKSLAVKGAVADAGIEAALAEAGQNGKMVSLSISVLAGVKPGIFLAKCSGSENMDLDSDPDKKVCTNTVVVLVELI
ncbi:MAG: hypothetical protein K9L30_08745 [Desulfobacterales bacterium]|nr:hypothetical protein [Desulfobacterales bacterium]